MGEWESVEGVWVIIGLLCGTERRVCDAEGLLKMGSS